MSKQRSIGTLENLEQRYAPVTGLIHHWPFDETAGTRATDVVGDNHGSLVNWGANETTWTPGFVGGALHFGDDNNYVITDEAVDGLEQFSVAFWARLVDRNLSTNHLIATPRGGNWISNNPSNGDGIGIRFARDDSQPMKEIWEHYVVTVDLANDAGRVFRDGVEVATGAVDLPVRNERWVFGHNQDTGNHGSSWRGLLDEMQIYDRLLTPEDAETLAYRPPQPEITPHLVVERTVFPGGGTFDEQEIILFIDPDTTDWIAWNRYPDLRAHAAGRGEELFIGSHGIGVNDHFDLTVTNPSGNSRTVTMDRNGVIGMPTGPQAVIYGEPDSTPDVLRGDNFQDPFITNEGGTQNELFTEAGDYLFSFRFQDIGGGAGYPNFYLLVGGQPIPQDPPQVVDIQVNHGLVDPEPLPGTVAPSNWDNQRSQILNITVEFTAPVQGSPADIVLTNLGVDALNDPDIPVELRPEQVVFNDTNLVLQFAPDDLDDGVFRLELSDSIIGENGLALDGDGDGTPGGSAILDGNLDNRFYKLTGDWNADFGVSVFDFPTLSYWFGRFIPGAPAYADLNQDGGVSIFDLPAFTLNFGNEITLPQARPTTGPQELHLIERLVDLVVVDAEQDNWTDWRPLFRTKDRSLFL